MRQRGCYPGQDVSTRRRPLVVATVAAFLSLAFLWGSMRTAGLASVPGAYTDTVAGWAYFQFLFSLAFGGAAVVFLLKSLSLAIKAVTLLTGLTAAFASLVAILGLLFAIAAIVGRDIYAGFALPILLAVAAASIAIYWRIVRRGGVGMAVSLGGLIVALAFTPLFAIGPFVFCGVFTPNIRCM